MFDLDTLGYTFLVLTLFAIVLWIASILKKDVGIVDSFWSLLILTAGLCFFYFAHPDLSKSLSTPISERNVIVLSLLFFWAIRLSAFITWRNWGQEEDSRYQTIRENNEPNFKYKSLYIVFLLQAWLALIVALPLMSIFNTNTALTTLDYIALALLLFGLFFEVVGDMQLARFKADENNRGRVMDEGLWRYTRHPNYFGEFCIWWAFFLFAAASGNYWSLISPVLVTLLLLKVSGVSLLESTIEERRPKYADYRKSTNAFFPWLPKKISQ